LNWREIELIIEIGNTNAFILLKRGDPMWFWNRVEIYCGFSLQEFSELRNSLAAAGIKYDYKLVNLNGSRARLGSFGQNTKYETQYYLYVHQKNYEHAMHLMSNRNT
jgi:hypothetical protein